jgi:Fe-S-cluster containining protein
MNKKKTSQTEVKYDCTKCGECCRNFSDEKGVILFPRDIREISNYLGLSTKDFQINYSNLSWQDSQGRLPALYILKHKHGNCIFLDDSGLCKIYSSRPIQCQRAPFNFFWSGSLDYAYECWETADVPPKWSSNELDHSLLTELYTNF